MCACSGAKVSSDEVAWVIQQADASKEGSLKRDEINAAVAVWYTKALVGQRLRLVCFHCRRG